MSLPTRRAPRRAHHLTPAQDLASAALEVLARRGMALARLALPRMTPAELEDALRHWQGESLCLAVAESLRRVGGGGGGTRH